MKRLTVACLAALLLASCSDPPHHGTVDRKDHRASYTWFQYYCAAYDSKFNCRVQSVVPITEPEHWYLCLRDSSTSPPGTGCRDVGETAFNRYHIGDYFPGEI